MRAEPDDAPRGLSPGDAARSQVPHPALDDLQQRLQAEVTALNASMRSTVMQVVKVGTVLIEAKATIGHGRWLDWVERTVRLKRRSVQHYMVLAERLPALSPSKAKRIAHLGIGDALRELRRDEGRPAPARRAAANVSAEAAPLIIDGKAERMQRREHIAKLDLWLSAGSRMLDYFVSGEAAASIAAEHDEPLNVEKIRRVRQFAEGLVRGRTAENTVPPQLCDPEIKDMALQCCHLLARFREISQKISPEELYSKVPANLMHNLDNTLADASFFVGDLHRLWAGGRP